MFELKSVLMEVSQKWNYKMEEISAGVFRMDVAIKMKDGSYRYQFVYVWMVKHPNNQRDMIYMNSRCGEYTPNLNLYSMMKEAIWGLNSIVTITTDKKADGSPCETVIVQASPYKDWTSKDMLDEIIYEVAANADIMEEKFFGGDKN